MAIDKKVHSIFALMQLLVERKILHSNDENLAQELGYSTKTLGRHLDDLATLYPNIITVKKGRSKRYEFVDISYVFEKIITTRDDLYWFFDLIERWDSSIFKDMNYKVSHKEKDVVFIKNSPFEALENQKQKEIFASLKSAIVAKRYIDIHYIYDEPRVHKQAIPLKLIFMERNWYVAIVDAQTGFRFLRVFFIQEIKNQSTHSYMNDVSKEQLSDYETFLKLFQNPMSLYGKPTQTAILKASSKISKYFKADMKQHFSSEKFIEELSDGSIIFSIDYSQPLEILPFIKRWLPDMKILSPQSLEDTLRSELKAYLA